MTTDLFWAWKFIMTRQFKMGKLKLTLIKAGETKQTKSLGKTG
jgi:hypothetical protein